MKNQYMTQKKEQSLENTHKLHKNSKTYLDAQNEIAPKLRGTTSLKFWKFWFFVLHFSIIYTFKNNILKFQVEISNNFWVWAF